MTHELTDDCRTQLLDEVDPVAGYPREKWWCWTHAVGWSERV